MSSDIDSDGLNSSGSVVALLLAVGGAAFAGALLAGVADALSDDFAAVVGGTFCAVSSPGVGSSGAAPAAVDDASSTNSMTKA
jgi:hypothetical protein